MTREEAITNLNMISVAFVEPVTKEQRTLINDTFEMAIQSLEQETCEDAISRELLKSSIHNFFYGLTHVVTEEDIQAYIEAMPSVTPKEKVGHWIEGEVWEDTDGGWGRWQKCSVCRQSKHHKTNFCPNCGARMESEE